MNEDHLDIDSLPPAFFSNVERLRLRLAQSDPYSTPNHPVNDVSIGSSAGSWNGSGSGARPIRRRAPGYNSSSSKGSSSKASYSSYISPQGSLKRYPKHQFRNIHSQSSCSRRLRKPNSLQLAALVAQTDSQCFYSLPAKIQQKLFSPEERRRFYLAQHQQQQRNSLICDAADEAFSRGFEKSPPTASTPASATRGTRTIHSNTPSTTNLPGSTIFYESSTDTESEPDMENPPTMDSSVYDSFRWLDEDGDLDLSLDEYHSHIANTTGKPPRYPRLPSFRRSLSFTTHAKHRPTPSMPLQSFNTTRNMIQPLSPLPPLSPLSPISPRSNRRSGSRSRPVSRRLQSSHGGGGRSISNSHKAKSSTSSIDPGAQYYQDPDARLKLRVYLASPQKFDEAIEFGFPSLDRCKENVLPLEQQQQQCQQEDFHEDHDHDHDQGRESISSKPARSYTGTFFEDDDGTVVGSPGESIESPDPLDSYTPPPQATPGQGKRQESPRIQSSQIQKPTILQRRQSLLPQTKTKTPLRISGSREMTLKMTLTRPDLREDSTSASASASATTTTTNTAVGSGSGSGVSTGKNSTSTPTANANANANATDDPLRLAELPPADRTQIIWEDLDEEGGVVRKMWRKLRRR
ncbi:hypothetical protein PENSTE_c025G09470 [Penicillium steckii]|uniref:Uncharacterized protein n=1 Tax=Penicillium steckii TaxID=303698 RepID=A0A1V6SR24_9EURO|nr:hypothetical protein PENSTE_c025G09470 [Penicillium steckii]